MKNKIIFTLLLSVQASLMNCQNKMNTLPPNIVIDEYHGQQIEDPYRYIEDLKNPAVLNWINQQNEISTTTLNAIAKKEFLINKQLEFDKKKLFTISELKITENNKHFYLKRLAKDNVPKLYYRDSFNGKEVLLFDPKFFKPKANIEYVINYIQPNWKGSAIAISLTEKGKEISEIIIIDTITGRVHTQVIENGWPSKTGGIRWLPDDSGFIYLHITTTDHTSKQFLKNTKSLFYKLGSDPKQHVEVFSKHHNPELNLKEDDYPVISYNSPQDLYLIAETPGAIGTYYNSYYLLVEEIKSKKWKPLFTKNDQIKNYIVKGDSLIYKTSKNAANFKICSTSILNPDFDNPQVLVEEKQEEVITGFDITRDGLYFVTSKNGVKASLFKLEKNSQKEIILPQVYGSLSLDTRGLNYPELWINARGWITNNKRFEYSNGKLTDKDLNSAKNDEQFKDIIVKEIEVVAHDGEKVPLSLFYNKNINNNSQNRVLMEGYGAFGISMKPSFQLRRLLWILEGGVYAVAHVRGGGEKGDSWHKGGQKVTKPNTWKDFISCAEYLIQKNITTQEQLAIWSGSAGGIMIGRAITERPDLFAAAIVEFGMLNTLRSENRATGNNIEKEYGSIKNPEEFKALLEMDPYHHIKKQKEYPSTLLTVGLNDARVPAWFSIKFAARLQAANIANTTNLLLTNENTGHGIDDTKMIEFERFATIISFALWQTGHPAYQLK